MKPRLITIAGPSKDVIFHVEPPGVSVGREPGNRIFLSDFSVSRRHCLIQCDLQQVSITDLGSRNGTFVNGKPITTHLLAHGDSVKIGDYQFLFLLDEGNATSASLPVELDERPWVFDSTTEIACGEDQLNAFTGATTPENSSSARLSRDFDTLRKISTVINSINNLEAMQRQLIGLIFEAIPAEHGAVLLTERERNDISSTFGWSRRSDSQRSVTVSRNIVNRVLSEGVALMANNVKESLALGAYASIEASEIQALLAAPLKLFEKVIGVIWLYSDQPQARFDDDHLQLMSAISGIAAAAIENARRMEWLEDENNRLRQEINIKHNMIGDSPRMRAVYQFISKAAPSDSTVLIRGESGTGKELAARAVWLNSPRASRPFVPINCAALTESLFESELFGYEKGAFTGANAQKKGKLEVADGGTVFLDEIGELKPTLQAKLLRVLQEQEFERVGGTKPVKINIRFIAATNRNLAEAIKEGSFREDLYYRINAVSITMPPLRGRREDISSLANAFIKNSQENKRGVSGIAREAMDKLTSYDWPGNVRELKTVIENAILFGTTEIIQIEDLLDRVLEFESDDTTPLSTHSPLSTSIPKFNETIRETKKRLIGDALRQSNNNIAEAARLLGMHPNNLHRLMKNLKLKA
jgi:Nif-specific regulatory protein